MSEPATAELIEQGIEAARIGNRLLDRLHFERAAQANIVDPLVWLWLAWVSDSPLQASTHLKKLQTGPYAALATAGLQWMKALAEGNDRPVSQRSDDSAAAMQQSAAPTESSANDANGPVYGLGCPGCRARLRIWGKLIGPLHNCPACGTVFVAEQDPNDPTRLIRRRLSSQTPSSEALDKSAALDAGQPLVLVLDDRTTRRQLMLNVLRRASFRVLAAVNGVEALALAIENQPQLILLDGNLQDQDAFAICREIRSCPDTRATPIIILSNKSGFFDQVQARLAGCTVYITKPCEAEALLNHVQKLTQMERQGDSSSESPVESCPNSNQPVPYAIHGLMELKDSAHFGGLDVVSGALQVSQQSGKAPAELQSSIFG
ncbi:MAG: response regulator receiver protein [Planctomycetaceae bacterium]|nr:response regulator receiver protein [Planctomycetaceae bacterium]